MKRLHVAPFRLGYAASTTLKQKQIDFYQGVGELVLGPSCRLIATPRISSIPVDNQDIAHHPEVAYIRLWESLALLDEPVDAVLIDLPAPRGGIVRAAFELRLASAIVDLLREHDKLKRSRSIRVIVLVPSLPPNGDLFLKKLGKDLAAGRMLFIDDEGRLLPSKIQPHSYNAAHYKTLLAAIRKDPMMLLQMKMIRRLGHFQRPNDDGTTRCVRYLYDGQGCYSEVSTLIERHIVRTYGHKVRPTILYQSKLLPWLERAVLTLAAAAEYDYMNIDQVLSIRLPRRKASQWSKTPPLLVVPLIDSGNSLRAILRQLRALVPISPHILAVLSTQGENSGPGSGVRRLSIEEFSFDVQYFLRVPQVAYAKDACPMCRLLMPPSSDSVDDHLMLTSWDFWEMVGGAGWTDEQDVPSHRGSLGYVPKFPELLEQNGPWLVQKIRQRMDATPNGLPADPVVICPDEKGSNRLSNIVKLLPGVNTVISVPRGIIDECKESTNIDDIVAEARMRDEPWFKQLSSTSADKLIVMDEFNASGGTRRRVSRLLKHFRKSELFYFCFVDFNPEARQAFDTPSFCLYEFQWL